MSAGAPRVINKRPTVVSLFSGAGGLDLGFVAAGAEIVWAIDNDKDACETYAKNISNHIVCKDVEDADFAGLDSPDIILGGFPCQGFSQANLRRSLDDERNVLYKYLLKCILKLRPKMFLAENVRGILTLHKGEAVAQIMADFRAAGYTAEHYLVNAADYGVPQMRRRVFFVGIRNDLGLEFNPPVPTHADPEKAGALGRKPWVSIGEALRYIEEPGSGSSLKNHIGSKYKVTNRDFTGHRATDPAKPSPTILARGNGKGGVCAIQHPNNHRRLTVRESAIIQTFPLGFEFMGSTTSMYRQVGNAVPVMLAAAFAENIVEALQ